MFEGPSTGLVNPSVHFDLNISMVASRSEDFDHLLLQWSPPLSGRGHPLLSPSDLFGSSIPVLNGYLNQKY